jgi:hypothetical protein
LGMVTITFSTSTACDGRLGEGGKVRGGTEKREPGG